MFPNERKPVGKPKLTRTVAVAATANTSDPLTSQIVRVISTSTCYVRVGTGAKNNDMLLIANEAEYFAVAEGDVISVIRDASDGTLYITEF